MRVGLGMIDAKLPRWFPHAAFKVLRNEEETDEAVG